MRSPTELTAAFRHRGLRITPQRELLFRLLDGNDAHPTADDLYAVAVAEMPSISLRTVYQTLHDLQAMGEIHAVDLGAGPIRFDPNVEDHHHLVCEVCGRAEDVHLDAGRLASTEPVVGDHGFEVSAVEVIVRGRCAACR